MVKTLNKYILSIFVYNLYYWQTGQYFHTPVCWLSAWNKNLNLKKKRISDLEKNELDNKTTGTTCCMYITNTSPFSLKMLSLCLLFVAGLFSLLCVVYFNRVCFRAFPRELILTMKLSRFCVSLYITSYVHDQSNI